MKDIVTILAFSLLMHLTKASIGLIPIWKPVVPNLVENKCQPAMLSRLSIILDDYININIEKRLLKIDSAILLSGFVKRPGSQTWISESALQQYRRVTKVGNSKGYEMLSCFVGVAGSLDTCCRWFNC